MQPYLECYDIKSKFDSEFGHNLSVRPSCGYNFFVIVKDVSCPRSEIEFVLLAYFVALFL